MGQAVPNPPPGFDDLPPEEKVEYVQSLWDRIAAGLDRMEIPDWHVQIVRERLAAYDDDPTAGRDWDQVKRDLRAKLDGSSER